MPEITTIALVTGGSRGIGRDTVLSLARRGVSSILTYRENEDSALAVVKEVEQAGARAVALPFDAARSDQLDAFVAEVEKALKTLGSERLDYLVNNAGSGSTATLMNGTEAEMDEQFAIHFKAPFLLTQALLPVIRDGGRIVNISSGLARFSFPGRTIYGPMKAAVEALTRYMAIDLAPRRITVNVVAPGAIATDFNGGATRDNAAVNKALADQTPLGRVGLPEDVGAVIAGILSADFGFVNAQRIEVSGGFRA
ncbi:SDR family NAD(P)-dependent oxidoreductase [Sphingobium fuliginis]|uniref:SDR family oxidoreductase n=1 Tax=Sphingobium fuliginis ATCC 27551 TaxID=1208342 RepID=A0A5B8CJH7_SPHSA|nr:SDR family oxidoreductase [Sphingobium fuliginis]QDC39638.1 SDR family oxidoreductase [Sphingobium fuliginis ATCC 27551]